MDLVSTIRKTGSRGGVNFSWDDVASSNHRENYLGHSLKAPVGRWAKGRDLTWYAKGDDSNPNAENDAEQARREEIRKLKEAEDLAMARVLGLPPPVRDASGANAITVTNKREADGGEIDGNTEEDDDADEMERKRRKAEKRERRERRDDRRRRRSYNRDHKERREYERRGRRGEDGGRRSPSRSQSPAREDGVSQRRDGDKYERQRGRERRDDFGRREDESGSNRGPRRDYGRQGHRDWRRHDSRRASPRRAYNDRSEARYTGGRHGRDDKEERYGQMDRKRNADGIEQEDDGRRDGVEARA